MPDADDAIEWDFFTLVDWWNLYGLPALLAVVAIAVVVRSRSRPMATRSEDGSRTVRLGRAHPLCTGTAGVDLAWCRSC